MEELFDWGVSIVVYLYFAACLHIMAHKSGTPNGWFAWIPILNLYLMCEIGDKPAWWLLLFFIPIVNILAWIVVWMGIAETMNKSEWVGILMVFPIVNLFVLAYLTFVE